MRIPIPGTKFSLKLTILTFWTKFFQKGHFWLEKKTVNIDNLDQICPRWQFLLFGPHCPKQAISGQKQKKWTSPLNSAYLNHFKYRVSRWIDNFNFMDQICPKYVFSIKDRKSEHHHWILHTRFSLGTRFQLQLIILTFWTKFAQKEYFQSKPEKGNISIEFCMFELVQVSNFSLNW